ncbi:hypothetical protein FAES_0859 [Fibrella aestuarina BUZ 2]|uniref:Uncharacterized protein n=1 Tax=Fibrella aestuarina BUZ 2 TaxID=1166018 RepID=I0K417_9BACT|nr:hypothetical protein FAES_0859 [Fibrella aestuarina BUZ 2]
MRQAKPLAPQTICGKRLFPFCLTFVVYRSMVPLPEQDLLTNERHIVDDN